MSQGLTKANKTTLVQQFITTYGNSDDCETSIDQWTIKVLRRYLTSSSSCSDIIDCSRSVILNLSKALNCCGDIFDPKPFLTNNGVCFTTRPNLKAVRGIFQNFDHILVTANSVSNVSTGLHFLDFFRLFFQILLHDSLKLDGH